MAAEGDFLIMSGSYIAPEMVAEFGLIPPAFLPFGMARLYERQVAFARGRGARVFITLPDNFKIPEADARWLSAAEVTVLPMSARLSLPAAMKAALAAIEPTGQLRVLHGDTLVRFEDDAPDEDVFGVGSTDHYAVWAEFEPRLNGKTHFREGLTSAGQSRSVICGYFAFADGSAIRRFIDEEGATFVGALSAYAQERRLDPVLVAQWLDFGHLQTYFQSRQADLASREFNSVVGTRFGIRKTGTPARKIYSEALWFREAPADLRPFLPQLYSHSTGDEVAYELEYLFLPSVSELFVFGNLPLPVWHNILGSCQDALDICHQTRPKAGETPPRYENRFFRDVVVDKTLDRIETFSRAREISLDTDWRCDGHSMPSLRRTVEQLLAAIPPTRGSDICLWHGDFHFANLLFDFRGRRVRVIDPRGMLSDGSITMFGDRRYDVSKLTHSVIGLYDFIVSRRFEIQRNGVYDMNIIFPLDSNLRRIQDMYSSMEFMGIRPSSREVLALTALLFFSMLPLHSDARDRQDAMLANAFRLARLAEEAV